MATLPPPGSAPVSNRLTLLNIQHLTLIPGPHAEFLRQLGNKAVEMGCKSSKNKRNPKNLKSSNFRFLDFFKVTFKNPDFRLTVTAENCCLSV